MNIETKNMIVSELVKIAGAVLGKVILDVPYNMRHIPGGILLPEMQVTFDGKYFGWRYIRSNLNAYTDESKFRYSLAQELHSQQNAMKLIDMLKEKWLPPSLQRPAELKDWPSRMATEASSKVAYGSHKTYGGDPYWLTLRYPAHCAKCHILLEKGERAYYYPKGKHMFGEKCGHGQEAERDFHTQIEMEEGQVF